MSEPSASPQPGPIADPPAPVAAATDTAPAPMSRTAQIALLATAALRVGLAAFAVLGVYYLLPEDSYRSERGLIFLVTFGMLLWLAAVIVQLSRLRRARHPVISAASALTFTIVLLVVIFAQVALMLAGSDPGAYNVTLDKPAALYFSMTITSTVGFGDIVPTSDLARNITSLQMFVNLVFLASAVRILVSAATSRKARSLT